MRRHYLYLLPTTRNLTFSLDSLFFFLLFFFFFFCNCHILGSCWNSAAGLATVEDLGQRAEVILLKILCLANLQALLMHYPEPWATLSHGLP